jgi:radical SAM superfamily enzyme YgiQ (UPF0313 family)
MKICVVAPMVDEKQANLDYNIKFKGHGLQATFYNLQQYFDNPEFLGNPEKHLRHKHEIPAGGYYLSAKLRALGHDTLLLNLAELRQYSELDAFRPDLVCISTTMILKRSSLSKICRSIKELAPYTLVVAGGVFVWKCYLAMRDQSVQTGIPSEIDLFNSENATDDVDVFVVSPHGIDSLLDIIECIISQTDIAESKIRNIAFREGRSGGFTFTQQISDYPDPEESGIEWRFIDELPKRIPIRTTIGCPFRCRFCDFYRLYPQVGLRSITSIKAELTELSRSGASASSILQLTDDNVFINQNRTTNICNMLKESDFSFWTGFLRASSVSDENIDLIRDSGLFLAMTGVESGDEEHLQRINKSESTQQLKKGIELLDSAGISVLMTFLVGFPGEDDRSIQNTISFMNNLDMGNAIASYQLYPLWIQTLSDLSSAEYRAKWQITGSGGCWQHFTMNSTEALQAAHLIFLNVDDLPYHYSDENLFFVQTRFKPADRRIAYRLRKDLTVAILENEKSSVLHQLTDNLAKWCGSRKTNATSPSASEIFNI